MGSGSKQHLSCADYHVAWICPAADIELLPARLMLDEEYDTPLYDAHFDENTYICGGIYGHAVVIATCPPGETGNVNAGRLSSSLFKTFPNIRMALLVGIGSGIPRANATGNSLDDVHLGDVVVGWPGDGKPACLYCDRGKAKADEFEVVGTMQNPDWRLTNALGILASDYELGRTTFQEQLGRLRGHKKKEKFTHPGLEHDLLFKPEYHHDPGNGRSSCMKCDQKELVDRPQRLNDEMNELVFHSGRIASSSADVHDGRLRDQLSARCGGAICIDMEAAGIDVNRRCLVVRGIADYADSHKSDTWKSYAAGNAAAFTRELLCRVHASPPLPKSDLETSPGPTFFIPFRRDPEFVDRGRLLDQIREKCSAPASRVALVGLGGIGKTQLAIEHCYRTMDCFPETWVFWIHASNVDRLEEGFRDIADRAELTGRADPQTNIIKLVYDWLRSDKSGKWLLVLDNADDDVILSPPTSHDQRVHSNSESRYQPRSLSSYLPQSKNGSVLVTSRNKNVALQLVEDRDVIPIDPMDSAGAQSLLEMKLGEGIDQNGIAELAEAVDFMPLALVQAAAYIKQRGPRCSVRRYLEQFQKSDKEKTTLLDYDGGSLRRDEEAKNSILITWQISFSHVLNARPSAAGLLSLMSFFDRQGIPGVLLRKSRNWGYLHGGHKADVQHGDREGSDDGVSGSDNDDGGDSETSDNNEFEEDILALRNYSFITATTNADTFEMHRLVQLATRKWLKEQDQLEAWKRLYIGILCTAFPSGNYENWNQCQALFPHAKSAMSLCPQGDESRLEWAQLLYNAAVYAIGKGSLIDTESLSKEALKVIKELLGNDHRATQRTLQMLSSSYYLRGWYKKAEEIMTKQFETCRRTFGGEDGDTLRVAADLAHIYYQQGRFQEAEDLVTQVVEIRKRVFGEGHRETLAGMLALATILSTRGELNNAGKLKEHVVKMRKSLLGEEHLQTLNAMSGLAYTYLYQGRIDMAEDLCIHVLKIMKRELGDDNRDTLRHMTLLPEIRRCQGRLREAEELGEQLIAIKKRVLGEEHPQTLQSMGNLAYAKKLQNRSQEALLLMTKCIQSQERVLGPDHPDTQISLRRLNEWRTGGLNLGD